MRLIAQHTIGLSKQIDAGAPADPGDMNAKPPRPPALARPPRYDQVMVPPNTEFESADYKLDDRDIPVLVRSGAVRRKTREVQDDSPRPLTAARGPASGATVAPDPNAVADRAMAGELALDRPRDDQPSDADFERMTKPELEDLAAKRGIDTKGRHKAEIIDALKAKSPR